MSLHLAHFSRRTNAALVGSIVLATVLSTSACTGGHSHSSASSVAPTIARPASEYLNGVSGPAPTKSVDLAGTWDFQPLTKTLCKPVLVGPQTSCVTTALNQHSTIAVPGGGWVKQGFAGVSEAVYSRKITVPAISGPQVTKLSFGAVNFQATVRVDDKVVATNTTSFLPSSFDLTPFVKPGGSYTISVDVKGRDALMDSKGYYTVPTGADWSPNIAQGIYRSAELDVYPASYISDAFVQTSVKNQSLTYQVSVTNGSDQPQTSSLRGYLASMNDASWKYPSVPAMQVSVPAHQTKVVTVGPIKWTPGAASYWWPNVPYRANYRAQLHDLTLALVTKSQQTSLAKYQFGFREIDQVGDHFELNGVRVNFRGDSLQGANYDSINYDGGRGDAYDTYPGFLKPSSGNAGWPQAVENYLRLNYNSVRIHQVAASPYMLDVADELGLMILDETAIRGSNTRENFQAGLPNMVNDAKDLVLRDRNHAAVLRWSQANEPISVIPVPGTGPEFDMTLYKTIRALDTTRPISTDSYGAHDQLNVPGYTNWCHYIPDAGGTDAGTAVATYTGNTCKDAPSAIKGQPYGQGEYLWSADSSKKGFTWFATSVEQMRVGGASDARPYALLDAWTSVIPGVTTAELTTEVGGHPLYGEDNLPDPWSNPQIQRVQKAFSPVLVADDAYWSANKLSNENGAWPSVRVKVPAGTSVTRSLVIFNDTFAGTDISVGWSLHTGSADGPQAASSSFTATVPLGSHVNQPITFTTPSTVGPLYLVLTASKSTGGQLFQDSDTIFTETDSH